MSGLHTCYEDSPDSSWLLNLPIAHRGFHSGDEECPENSIKAFESSVQKQFSIELDVHLLSDGTIAVFHDNNLKRMTGMDKEISKCNSSMIKKLRLLGSDNQIPLLDEVLDVVKGKVPLLIELKNMGKVGMPEKTLFEIMKNYNGNYAVQSFNPYSLHWFRDNVPNVVRGQLLGYCRGEKLAYNTRFLLKNFLFNKVSQFDFINYDIRWLPAWVIKRLKMKGIPVIGWTARSIPEYQRAGKWCDNVVFEGFDPSWLFDIKSPFMIY